DGTGGPSRHGNVAVKDGRIVEVGGAAGQATRERVKAEGRVVAPGFIDPHTHYDAQVAWDPLVTCSSWHGVTTVVTGNCGVGVALAALSDQGSDEEVSTLTLLGEESRRPVTFLAVFARPGKAPGSHEEGLTRVAHLFGRDRAVPQVSCRPLRVQFTLKNPFIFAGMAPWSQAFNRTVAEQTALYRSAAFRTEWKAELERRRARGLWPRITIRDATT